MSIFSRLPIVNGEYRKNFMLANLTRFKVGGTAEIFFKPKDEQDLSYFLSNLPIDIPVTVLGAGSNVIIRDGGIEGVTIKLGKEFNKITFKENSSIITVGASTLNYSLSKFCLQYSLGGLEFLVGIPGSVGGGISMNAGAYGSEFKDVIHSVEALDRFGNKHLFACRDLDFKYRECGINGFFVFTKANFTCYKGNQEDISKKMQEINNSRKLTQPINEKTGGSTFRNPANCKAWRLIDRVGLRGYMLGDAIVSNLHCNFLINNGCASASNLENLGKLIHAEVLAKTAIDLKWEIKIIGKKITESN